MTGTIQSLRRFAARARNAEQKETCELCAGALQANHGHVVDKIGRRIHCACAACIIAFAGDNGGRFRTVPSRPRRATATIAESDLSALGVPVGLAFFFRSSTIARWIAVFPSPAGPTEAELSDEAWAVFAGAHPAVRGIADDVEALLVRARRGAGVQCLIAPIDACYELTGIVRRTWAGIDGGDPAREAIDSYIERLVARAEGGGKG